MFSDLGSQLIRLTPEKADGILRTTSWKKVRGAHSKPTRKWDSKMTYDELSKEAEKLNYRDKLRLAQRLIQLSRKEEEEQNPKGRNADGRKQSLDPELIQYVAERLHKLKPSKKETLLNSIGAMFQFQGGISDSDKERIFSELKKVRHINIGEKGRIQYPRAVRLEVPTVSSRKLE